MTVITPQSALTTVRPSRTAQLMAVQRGLESSLPARARLFTDPYAPRFVSPAWRVVLRAARVAPVRRAVEMVYDRVGGPGPRPSAIARTRLIDDVIDAAAGSLSQLVILGAGYDTRAHRLASLKGTAVFELDRLPTQRVKRAALAAGPAPAGAPMHVPVDFERDDLCAALGSAGFARGKRAMFLWEGVSQYLTAEAVDATLAAIRRAGAPGDRLVFTYVDDAALGSAAARFPEAARWLRGTARRGEPWIYGLDPATLGDHLAARGFALESDESTREAGERYFPGRGRQERGSGLYRVAVAELA